MSKIKCDAGNTQIELVLDHVAREHAKRKINALVFVGDCCEEQRRLGFEGTARLFAQLEHPRVHVPGGRGLLRAETLSRNRPGDERGVPSFDQGSLSQLAELLRLVSIFAVGGVDALESQNSTAAKLLLGQIKR
jgi:hypothetical protein